MPRYTFTTELEPGLHVAGLPKCRYEDPAVRAAVRTAFHIWRGTYTQDEVHTYRLDNGRTIDEQLAKYPMRVRNASDSDFYLELEVRIWDVETGELEPGTRNIVTIIREGYTTCRAGYGTGARWENPCPWSNDYYEKCLEQENR